MKKSLMVWSLLGGLVGSGFLAGQLLSQPSLLPGNRQFFTHPPRLVNSSTTFNAVSVWAAKYYFTLALPEDAGSPLAKVVFQQQQSPDPIDFYPDQTTAFYGDRHQRQAAIALSTTTWDAQTGQFTVEFAESIPPGNQITVRLKPKQNPDFPGVYQFRVYAFPPGKDPQSIDLGLARFQFYRNIF